MIKRPLFGLDIVEVGKAFQVGAQMLGAERALEAGAARALRLVAATERLEHLDACVFPVEVRPAASPVLGRIDHPQRLFRAAGLEQAPGNIRSDLRDLSRLLIVLSDEGIHVALGVRNLPQGETNGALAA